MIITDLNKLREKSQKVSSDEAPLLIKELEKALDISKGIGLAAIQIGIPKRAAIVRIGDININLINSEITKGFDLIEFTEGCLSIPNVSCRTKRYSQVVISNDDERARNFCVYGLPSICVQHEIDHWEGILMIDREIKATTVSIELPNMPCKCGSGKKHKKCCGRKNG